MKEMNLVLAIVSDKNGSIVEKTMWLVVK